MRCRSRTLQKSFLHFFVDEKELQDHFEDKLKLTLKMASFGALSNAETIRKGKGRGKGKGKGSRPGGQAQRSTNAEDYIYSTKIEMQQVVCHFCGERNIEGTHKCQSCFK